MMQVPQDQSHEMQNILEGSKELLIGLPKSPSLDEVAAALSLYLVLSSKGKQVKVVCPSEMTVEFNQLIGVDKITSVVNGGNGRNLVISFPYEEGSIEKVSYNIENATFNLVIEPRENYPLITPDVIRYSFGGGNTDAIITVGISSLSDLDNLYQANQDLFSNKPVINIDIKNNNQRFGKVNLVDPSASSVSELLLYLFSQIGLQLDPDTSTNLLNGITHGSQYFTSQETSISTFEAATICLRNGARKIGYQESAPTSHQAQTSSFFSPTATRQSYPPKPAQTRTQIPAYSPSPNQLPRHQTGIKMPTPRTQQSYSTGSTQKPSQPQQTVRQKSQSGSDAPPDWLKPKIYKGSTLL